MTPQQLWHIFSVENQITHNKYDVFQFGMSKQQANELAQLVLSNEKTATSSAYPLYELENEKLPSINEYSIILDGDGQACCIIQTIKMRIVPFHVVSVDHAYKEGEDDKTLAYWQHIRREFLQRN